MTQLIAGWNLVNSGGYTNSFNELTDNSDKIELIYEFKNGNYHSITKQTNLTQGKSYWVFCTETVILTHDLGKNGENILEIYEGWNLIACPRNSSMFLSDIFDTNIDTVNAVVKWNGGNYVNIDLNNDPEPLLEPGVGYWVLVSRAFKIEVTWFLKGDRIYGNSTSIPLGNKIFATKNVFYSNSGTEENMYFFDNTTLSKRRFSPAVVDPDGLPMPPPYIFNTNKDVEYLLIFSKETSNVKYVYFIKYISTENSLDRYKFRLPTAFKEFGNNDIIVFGRGYGINTPEPTDARLVRSDAEEGEVYVYDFEHSFNRYNLTITIKFTNAESLAITPDGNVLAIGNKQNITIYNISDDAVIIGNEISLNNDVNTMNMALSGNGKTIAFTENGTSVHVYRCYNTLDNDKNWGELGDLQHEGLSVDIDHEGTTVVFGAPDIERIYIDEWNGNEWITSHINGISLNLSNRFKFGTSISLNNNLIAVGSPQSDLRYETGTENDVGEIHIFEKKGYVKDDSLYKNRFSFDYLGGGNEIDLSSEQTFTTINRDLLRTNILLKASRQWSELIKSMPGEDNLESDNRKITINVGFFTDDSSNCTEGTCIGGAAAFNDTKRDTNFNYYFNNYTLNGFMYLNNTLQYSRLQYTAGHEIGHVLGIGGMWRDDYCKDTLKEQQQDDNSIERNYYKGQNALNVYKWYNATGEPYIVDGIDTNYTNNEFSDATSYIGIPIEQDGGGGTAEGHLEEGDGLGTEGNIITSGGLEYCGLRNEIMTGISTSSDIISAITVGLLADLGYGVNWEKSQPFDLNQTTNRNSNGKDFLKMKCSNGHCHLNEIVRNKQVKVLEFKSK